jgi:hypothetical protein
MFNPEFITKPKPNKENFNQAASRIENEFENGEISEKLSNILKDFSFLKDTENNNENSPEYREKLKNTIEEFSEYVKENGGQLKPVTDVYNPRISKNEKLIVRREDPEKVAKLLEGKDINLNFDTKVVGDRGDKYANCAIWPYGKSSTAGIKNAFKEGRGAAGPIVTMIASKKNPEYNKVSIPDNYQIRTGTIDREAVRIVSGKIKKEDLEFMVLRVHKNFFPEDLMSEDEKESEMNEVFRAFDFKY